MAVPVQAQGAPPSPSGSGTIAPEKVREGIDLDINGERFRHTGDPKMPLLWYLRDVLQLTGTKYAGEHGSGNGADLVLINGKLTPAIGAEVFGVDLGGPLGDVHRLQLGLADVARVGVLQQQPARNLLEHRTRRSSLDFHQAQILFSGEPRARFRSERRRSNGFHKELGNFFRGFRIDRTVVTALH